MGIRTRFSNFWSNLSKNQTTNETQITSEMYQGASHEAVCISVNRDEIREIEIVKPS